MKALLQRVSQAKVDVADETIAEIGKGLLVLFGVEKGDEKSQAEKLARKTADLRIFDDEAGQMNLSVSEVGGEVLAVSQFTLAADTRKGRRPSFIRAAPPDQAEALFEHFKETLAWRGVPVQSGRFQTVMAVHLVNDGPVTILLEA